MSAVLRCRDLKFRYAHAFCLRIDRLHIPAGSVFVIEGPNGSGKSTLLWLLCGLLQPGAGTVTAFEDGLAAHTTAARRRMTLVMESPYLLRGSVRRNVEYGLARRGIDRHERRRRVDEALHRVRMERHADRMTWQLSSGERKRVALARALALKTDILLLDEPTAFVDRQTAVLVDELIEVLRQKTTIVISTHDVEQARRVADDVVTLLDGALSRVSHENAFEARAVARDGRRIAQLTPTWEVPLGPGPEGPVSLLLDPSRIRVSPAAANDSSFRVSGLNAERHTVRIQVEGSPRLVIRVPRDRAAELGLELGRPVSVDIPPEAVHVRGEDDPIS